MNLKAFVSLLPLAALTLAPMTAPVAAAAPAVTKPLPVGTCINLGNTLEAEREGSWGGVPVRQEDLQRIADAGFTTIRLPVRWHNKSSNKPPYTVDPKWMDRVQQIVDWALAAKLNVILNSHHFDPIYDDPAGVAEWHGGVWKQIAERFKGYPEDTLWFELENEPHKNLNHANLLKTLAPALGEVRKLHPTRAVIIGGENWSGIKSLETLPLPDDVNIHPTFHYYDPFLYTHQGAEWTKPDMPPVGRSFPLPEDTAQLARDVAAVKAYVARTGKTPFMGEVGAYDGHIPLADRVKYHRTIHDAFAPTGIGMCMWAYTNTFPFYDYKADQWLPGLRGAIGLKDDTTAPPAPPVAAAPAPAAASSSSHSAKLTPELAAFDAQVPGDLINDPTRIDWASYGPMLAASGRQSADIPGGGAARVFDIKTRGQFPYEASANVPLLDDVSTGEQVTIGFYARVVSTERSDGKGTIGVRFQENVAPYDGFGDTTVLVGSDWEWHEVTARATRRLRKADAIVTLQLAGAKQKLEIGQAIVVKNAATIQNTAAAAPTLKDAAGIEMPDSLRTAGQLVNDPTNRSWLNGGSGGTWEAVDMPEIWLQKATRFITAKPGENRWDLSTAIPILPEVKEGDQFVVAIVARTISAQTEDAKGLIFARMQGSFPPYDGFGDKAFKIGDRWQMIQLPFTATRGFGPGDATVTLHLAAAAQNVEVGPVYVFKKN